MTYRTILASALLACSSFGVGVAAQSAPPTGELGSITFPTSAKGAAQNAFLTGVKALHNFEFDLAGDAFRDAQTIRASLSPIGARR